MIENAGHPEGSYYRATADRLPPQPEFAGEARADVCILGAGFTGLGAALALAARGFSVAVLEAAEIGSGASGRNGGQVHSGHRRDQGYLEAALGRDAAHALWQLSEDAKAYLKELITRHRIACDFKPGMLTVDHKPRFVQHSRAYADKLARDYGYPHLEVLDRESLAARLGATGYFGGVFDRDGGHLHPLNLALGMAAAAMEAGARIYERSRITGYERQTGGKVAVATQRGRILADWLILAGDGYMAGVDGMVEARVMPINNFILATEPLGEARAVALIRDDCAVSDSRFVVNYFRLSADKRLLFGGGENYRAGFPPDLKEFVRHHMLKVFPQLADARIDYAWGGTLGITATRLPLVRRVAPNVLTASGYSGLGVMLGPYFGKILGDAVGGTLADFDRLSSLPVPPFPGGRLLRWPILVAGMTYFALRDRL
jgi:gamma-glutamylputrescine oxidase